MDYINHYVKINLNFSIGAVVENIKGGFDSLAKICAHMPKRETFHYYDADDNDLKKVVLKAIETPPEELIDGYDWDLLYKELKSTTFVNDDRKLVKMFSDFVLPYENEQDNIMLVVEHNCNKHGNNRLWQVVCLPPIDWNWDNLPETEAINIVKDKYNEGVMFNIGQIRLCTERNGVDCFYNQEDYQRLVGGVSKDNYNVPNIRAHCTLPDTKVKKQK